MAYLYNLNLLHLDFKSGHFLFLKVTTFKAIVRLVLSPVKLTLIKTKTQFFSRNVNSSATTMEPDRELAC